MSTDVLKEVSNRKGAWVMLESFCLDFDLTNSAS